MSNLFKFATTVIYNSEFTPYPGLKYVNGTCRIKTVTWTWNKTTQCGIKHKSKPTPSKQKLRKFSLIMFRTYTALCTSIFFIKNVYILQYSNIKFWRCLKLHIGSKNVLFQSECSCYLRQCRTARNRWNKTNI